mmetsp:Transcript_129733/g.416196  ORF Transcript_129733/g.416196 Transcript_129733/m.416196 type:complete len:245 (+) Transcript_129733:772-1506(+)
MAPASTLRGACAEDDELFAERPSCPLMLSPQAKTSPRSVSARTWSWPHATDRTLTPGCRANCRSVQGPRPTRSLPWPVWPNSLEPPHERSVAPSCRIATKCSRPALTAAAGKSSASSRSRGLAPKTSSTSPAERQPARLEPPAQRAPPLDTRKDCSQAAASCTKSDLPAGSRTSAGSGTQLWALDLVPPRHWPAPSSPQATTWSRVPGKLPLRCSGSEADACVEALCMACAGGGAARGSAGRGI